jgi:hypothetical protein
MIILMNIYNTFMHLNFCGNEKGKRKINMKIKQRDSGKL